ncbi:Low-density lipoprotein receptor- protein 6 [Chamberlinius hualienensis]
MKTFLVTFACLLAAVHAFTGNPPLIFANRKDIRLAEISRPRFNSNVVFNHLEDATSVDFYYDEKLVFWGDISLEMIKSSKIGSPNVVENVITTGISTPEGLACDWLTKKIYWTDSETNRIEVSNFDGTKRKVLFWRGIDQPRAIALSPFDGLMFWTDWGEIPRVERAAMDGHNLSRVTIINQDISWPNGITVDYETKRIYWADGKLKQISSADFDGKNRKLIAENLEHPLFITIASNVTYWTDWNTRSIFMYNMTSNMRRLLYIINPTQLFPMGINVYSAERQPKKTTPCHTNNGGCSHLCLLSPDPPFYTCACSTGVPLKTNTTCFDDVQYMLLLARRTDIRRISLQTLDFTDVVLPIKGVKHAIAIDYDPVDNFIYWSDDEVKSIKRAYINGSKQEDLIVIEVDHPDGIAVDWIARNLYWTDTGTDRIEVARLNGTSRKIIINQGLVEPRAIALDPVRGYMFWSDWGDMPMIERAALDGSDRVAVVTSDLGWPNGLALDYECLKIYWGDAKTDTIEISDYDGKNRVHLVTEQIPHIFGFSLLDDYIYWADWQRRTIERVNKITGTGRTTIIDQLSDLMGLKAVRANKDWGTNLCANNNGGCSHLCFHRPNNSYVCSCPIRMELAADQKTCIVPDAFLLFSHRSDIRRLSLETNHNNIAIPLQGIKIATSLDFDLNDNRIYWIDIGSKSICRAFTNGSHLDCFINYGLDSPEEVAVDWVARNIYWTDMVSKRIEVSRLDGSSRKVLIWENISSPHSIVLDPGVGFMYWSDWGGNSRIECAALDGSMRRTFMSDVGRATGLTIDYEEKKIYWIDTDSKIIEFSDLQGGERTTILSKSLTSPYGLTQYQDYIYWTDIEDKSIERANKHMGSNRVKIESSVENVMDILVFHASRQSGWNPCSMHNDGCSHLCLAIPLNPGRKQNSNHQFTNYTCACPTHYTLEPQNKTSCQPPKSFMLLSLKNQIVRVVFGSSDVPDFILPINVMKHVKNIDYDFIDRQIYWIDERTGSIKRAYENGSQMPPLVPNPTSNLFDPFDLAVDPYSRLVFWSCEKTNVINVTRMNGSSVGAVIGKSAETEHRPRWIALYPLKGLLFWVNGLKEPRIERCYMDGTTPLTLFTDGLKKPNSLTVDETADVIYWSDIELKQIVSANIEGGNRRTIYNSDNFQPISITVYLNHLYWIDKSGTVMSILKGSGGDPQRVLGRYNQMADLVSINQPSQKDLESHVCYNNKPGCSHLCMINSTNGKARCACPLHLVLKDDLITCEYPQTCASDYFACKNNNGCIPKVWRCDGTPECLDKSDEKDCPTCNSHQFHCRNGDCIDLKYFCDKTPHCQDGSDEEHCCQPDEFMCATKHVCISSTRVCDHKQDCNDGSDERQPACSNASAIEGESKKTSYTIGTVVAALVIIVIVSVVVIYRRRIRFVRESEEGTDSMLPFESINSSVIPAVHGRVANTYSNWNNNRGLADGATSELLSGVRGLSVNDSGVSNIYSRSHVTGASSSSSGATRYPQETLNPPPSPVTDKSQYSTHLCAAHMPSYLFHQSYRHYRTRNIPPPPTPCSTDVCDDSEPCGNRSRYQSDFKYEFDPYPPPPTPRSHYMSEDNFTSCPPSPSTVRSFYNPYPPPPSPEGPLDF